MAVKHVQADGTSDYQVTTAAATLKGWSLGAAVTDAVIHDGADATGEIVAYAVERNFFCEGIRCSNGIFVSRTTTTPVIIYYE